MLTISSGHSARYLTDAVAAGRENYYTGAVAEGEPPGRWYGAGAQSLGLAGLVDAQDMTALYERFLDPRAEGFTDPEVWGGVSTLGHTGRRYLSEDEIYARALDAEPGADAERRDQLRVEASTSARKNVSFLDATFSVQKSITVLHTAFEAQQVAARNAGRLDEAAAWGAHREAVEDAIWAGNKAGLDYLSQHAGFCRVGHHGGAAGRWVDAHGWTIASFFQHDSRDHDPQLHIHNAILNRVEGADGVWRTLDGRSIYRYRGAAGAVAERATEEHLTRALGVRFAMRPDGKAREVVGVAEAATGLFSSRSRSITPKQAELIAAFTEKFGRAPNGLERSRLALQATLATRRAKSHEGQPREAWLTRWDTQLRTEIAGGLAQVADDVLGLAGQRPEPVAFSPLEVIETALAAVQAKKAAWTEPDLIREISNALPDTVGLPEGTQIGELLDRLGAQALTLAVALDTARPGEAVLPEELRRDNGESVYQAPGARLYATPGHIHTERFLIGATTDRTATAMGTAAANRFLSGLATSGIELGVDQAAAVRGVLTSGARVETLIGPAGTGKSFVVGALAKAWQDPDLWARPTSPEATPDATPTVAGLAPRVFGLATSQIAAHVLAGEGLTAANTARWLATQARLGKSRTRDGDSAWALRPGDLVVIDESSMADTAALAEVYAHVEAGGSKLLLVGDHRQLAAVGAGGGLDLLAQAGGSYELAEARRFSQQWERAASLRLRAGDTSVIAEYHKQGRIIDGGAVEQTEEKASQAWLADTLAGKQTVLVVDDNEQAARLNARLRAELVRLGRVEEDGVPLGREGTFAGVGDVVSARRLAWELAGFDGNTSVPTTRERYRVQQIRGDGLMVVAPILDRHDGEDMVGELMTLPASYVSEDLTLGYAGTGHAAQGISVDTGMKIATTGTTANALYPGSTRGRESNTIFVVTQTAPSIDAEDGEVAEAPRQDPRAILTAILDNAAGRGERSATTRAEESAHDMAEVRTAGELFADEAARVTTARTATWLDQLTDTGALTPDQRARLAAEDGAATLGRVLRRVELAGGDPRQVLAAVIEDRSLAGARTLANVIHTRITDRHRLDPTGDTFAAWTPRTDNPRWARYLDALATNADNRRGELGDQAVTQPPGWAIETFGPVPADPAERASWRQRAATVAAHRELTGHTDPDTAIGAAPAPGHAEAYASWRAAWRALGRPEADRDEMQMSDGQLRMRMRAYEREQVWAPRHVANELAGTIHAADTHRGLAHRRKAEAQATTSPTDRRRLLGEAADAAALADTLNAQVEQLRELDEHRAHWYAHTAATRAAHARAEAEISARHAGDPPSEDRVTAADWLTAHNEAMRAEDPHRDITDDTDLTDHTPADPAATTQAPLATRPEDVAAVDVREVAATEPTPVDQNTVRVPTADETSESVRRAQRALIEIRERDLADRTREADDARAEQLARWHTDDRSTEVERSAEHHDPTWKTGHA